MHVVRRELEVPPHLARVAVQREHRVGVQVVAQPHLAAVVGAGVAGAPVDEVELGIVRAGDPGRRPAGAPRVAQPRLVVGMIGPRNRVRPPRAFAGLRVVRVEEPADAELPARDARHHPVLDDERRRGLAVAAPVIRHLRVPHQVARARVDGDQVRVERAHVERLAQDGDAAVVPPAADAQVVRQGMLVAPERPSGRGVDRRHVARRLGDEHHAVDHQRGRLGPVELADVVGPLQFQVGHVGTVYLVETREALAVERAVVHQPVVRLVRRVDQALPGDGRELRHALPGGRGLGGRNGSGDEQGDYDEDGRPLHGFRLLWVPTERNVPSLVEGTSVATGPTSCPPASSAPPASSTPACRSATRARGSTPPSRRGWCRARSRRRCGLPRSTTRTPPCAGA